MSGLEDDVKQVGVEAYVLKKVTKDLPLHPFPLAHKSEQLQDLILADSHFRTPLRALI